MSRPGAVHRPSAPQSVVSWTAPKPTPGSREVWRLLRPSHICGGVWITLRMRRDEGHPESRSCAERHELTCCRTEQRGRSQGGVGVKAHGEPAFREDHFIT